MTANEGGQFFIEAKSSVIIVSPLATEHRFTAPVWKGYGNRGELLEIISGWEQPGWWD